MSQITLFGCNIWHQVKICTVSANILNVGLVQDPSGLWQKKILPLLSWDLFLGKESRAVLRCLI